MQRTRRALLIAATSTTVLAGCLGDDDDSDTDDTDDETDPEDTDAGAGSDAGNDEGGQDDSEDPENDDDQEEPTAAVKAAETDAVGRILVGPDGRTLYMFESDEQNAASSTCYDECAENWPPLLDEADPIASDEVAAELYTFERDDGDRQVAVNGWPLYYWVGDEEPGDVDGQGVNDVWWVLDTNGEPIREAPDDDADDSDASNGPAY